MIRRGIQAPAPAVELLFVTLLAACALASVPLLLGGLGLGWDALNHHMYLGWIADEPRFDRDFMAAAYQSFQYPYLYWPVYKLYQLQVPGALAGAMLACLQALVVPALWLLSLRLIDERSWYGTAMRAVGVTLAFLSGVVLSNFDSTANDLLAAIPLVWSVAVGFAWRKPRPLWATALSGALASAAVAFKLSNGPLALVLPLLWMSGVDGWRARLAHLSIAGIAAAAALALLFGPWGWAMWTHYGNPVYPFGDGWFARLRDAVGHHP